jgi:hypothetical protein
LSNTITSAQIKDSAWSNAGQSKAGTAWYRSFTPDILTHRVCNSDTVVFHVNDIELLSSYNTASSYKKRLPFPVEFENEKVIAYRLKGPDFNQQIIKEHGPLIAEPVSGTGVVFHNSATHATKQMQADKYLYIEPATAFYFSATEKNNIEWILLEIK